MTPDNSLIWICFFIRKNEGTRKSSLTAWLWWKWDDMGRRCHRRALGQHREPARYSTVSSCYLLDEASWGSIQTPYLFILSDIVTFSWDVSSSGTHPNSCGALDQHMQYPNSQQRFLLGSLRFPFPLPFPLLAVTDILVIVSGCPQQL